MLVHHIMDIATLTTDYTKVPYVLVHHIMDIATLTTDYTKAITSAACACTPYHGHSFINHRLY